MSLIKSAHASISIASTSFLVIPMLV